LSPAWPPSAKTWRNQGNELRTRASRGALQAASTASWLKPNSRVPRGLDQRRPKAAVTEHIAMALTFTTDFCDMENARIRRVESCSGTPDFRDKGCFQWVPPLSRQMAFGDTTVGSRPMNRGAFHAHVQKDAGARQSSGRGGHHGRPPLTDRRTFGLLSNPSVRSRFRVASANMQRIRFWVRFAPMHVIQGCASVSLTPSSVQLARSNSYSRSQ
jgi:hypothetical protein